VRRALVILGSLALVVLGAGPASAVPPLDLDDRVTDQVEALGPDVSAVEDGLEELSESSAVDLHAAFVDGFEENSDGGWVEETADMSGLSDSDILFAVAVGQETYEYEWWVNADFPLSQVEVEGLIIDEVLPRLESRDWGAAVVALADGLGSLASAQTAVEEASAPEWSGTTTALVVGGVAVVLLGAHLLSRRRSPAGTAR
jgi:uncharacterized membrane protein YgcG